MLKKVDIAHERIRGEAAAGVSIMTPSGTSARNGTPRSASSLHALLEQRARRAHLVDRDDQRQHDAHVAVHAPRAGARGAAP